MTNITNFFDWFFTNLPTFLLSDPIKYFTGFFFLGAAVTLIRKLIGGYYD